MVGKVRLCVTGQDGKRVAAFFELLNEWRRSENAKLFWVWLREATTARQGLGGLLGRRRGLLGGGGGGGRAFFSFPCLLYRHNRNSHDDATH